MPAAQPNRWSADWLTGVVFSILFFAVAYLVARSAFYSLETAAYDLAMRMSFEQPYDRIAIVVIDERSIDNIGRWPWTRDVHASLVDRLAEGGARVIAGTLLLSEPEPDPELPRLRELQQFFSGSSLAERASQASSGGARTPLDSDLMELARRLEASRSGLDSDARLGAAIEAAGNTILPMGVLTRSTGPARAIPDYVRRNALRVEGDEFAAVLPAAQLKPPIPVLGQAANGLGHSLVVLDADGAVRREPLVVNHGGNLYPSLALAVAAASLGLTPADIEVNPGETLQFGDRHVRTGPDGSLLSYFYVDRAGRPPFTVDSFYEVWTGLIPADKFRDKIVLIGADAPGIGDRLETPVATSSAPVMVLAHVVSSLLQEDYFVRPTWAGWAEAGTLLVLTLLIALVLPRLRPALGAFIVAALVLTLLGTELASLLQNGIWLQLVVPATFLLAGHLVMSVKRSGLAERLRRHADAESAESNKMLALAFQSQGQLDMAFEKFRKCPLDDSMMELLYNLALDFERKRQFNKAGAVYGFMAEYDADFRDLRQRLRRSESLDETMTLGTAGSGARQPFLLTGGVEKPTLGRYEIEQELGKGAMGVVYLGRDPTINRVVAIKTIPLAEEFDEDDLPGVRDRFFREAETAGRLNHPDIVTIYDVGEDHDLAYIAMEYLKGGHLHEHSAPNTLLPPGIVMEIIARAAEALSYAHHENVVHRDIKPANIMYDPASNEVKITDFGIARLTNSTKTRTGIVLGTPSFMSPEQVEGKNVNGGSDLFSLGVTLYQLLTGKLPFQADSMTSLMFKIANDLHTPICSVRSGLPEAIEEIIDKALQKDPAERFRSGAELAAALRECRKALAP